MIIQRSHETITLLFLVFRRNVLRRNDLDLCIYYLGHCLRRIDMKLGVIIQCDM